MLMIESYLRNVIEAALLAAGRPLTLAELGQLFDEPARPDEAALGAALEQLGVEYAERGIELKQTASGWRVQVRREFSAEVSRLWPERPARYSRALLETLALIAYRQPITRGEIEDVRGVAVNPNIVKTLLERNWVRVVGQRDVPGRPELLGTTREFLDYFGLKSLDELPPLSELKALSEMNLHLDLPASAAAPADTEQAALTAEEGLAAASPPQLAEQTETAPMSEPAQSAEQAQSDPVGMAAAPATIEDEDGDGAALSGAPAEDPGEGEPQALSEPLSETDREPESDEDESAPARQMFATADGEGG